MALTREVVGALSHAELVNLVVRQSVLIDELQAVIAQQQLQMAQLEARVREWEQQLAQRDRDHPTKRMPGLKPAATLRRRKDQPRKRRAQGFSRPLSPTPTEVVRHAQDACPHCATSLSGGRERWRKEIVACRCRPQHASSTTSIWNAVAPTRPAVAGCRPRRCPWRSWACWGDGNGWGWTCRRAARSRARSCACRTR